VADYRQRLVDDVVADLFSELPALQIVGPRAAGKTTIGRRHAASVARLDDPADAAVFSADPDAALRGLPEPVLIDEWQAVPSVLGAVKRSVDDDFRAGRFILTGSVRADQQVEGWPGTGRIVRVAMYGLTIAERLGRATRPLIDRLVDGADLDPPPERLDLRDYLEVALHSGFPETAGMSEGARARFLSSYVDQLVFRDAASVAPRRDPDRLRRYFEAYAVNTAGNAADATLAEAAAVNRATAQDYEELLTALFVIDALPAWSSNRLRRLVRTRKRYLVEPALLVGLLGVDVAGVMRDADLLGRVLDTFVLAQLRAEREWAKTAPRLYHVREHDGRREIDIVAEVGARQVVGIEVKATSAPSPADARHLAWLRDQLGSDFAAGVVLHTGPRTFSLGDRITAAPIGTLWA